MNIVIISYANEFPVNSASMNRTLSYCKGLRDIGHKVSFLLSSAPKEGCERIGNYKGIPYEFILSKRASKCYIFRFLENIIATNFTIKKLNKINLKENIDYIKIPVSNQFNSLKFIKFCKKNNIKTFQERSEFPQVVLKTKGLKKLYRKMELNLYLYRVLTKIDVLILMTHKLVEYYSKKANKDCKILHMPMTVDVSRFNNVVPFSFGHKYIAYCGSMNCAKDGVDILIKAFGKLVQKFPDLKLLLIGPQKPESDYKYILNIIKKINIKEQVIFTGLLNRNCIPSYLCGAEALCLARPMSKQAQRGFPTKLGEYLLTGKPVVVTKVGEIPNYLIDKKNVFFAEPDSVESFSEKLAEALLHEDRDKIAKNGRDVALSVFNSEIQSKKLGEFLERNR